eukprot:15366258-Ditylum_brightwellii.AAC.1
MTMLEPLLDLLLCKNTVAKGVAIVQHNLENELQQSPIDTVEDDLLFQKDYYKRCSGKMPAYHKSSRVVQ